MCSGDKVLHIGRSATTLSKRFAALGDAANASLHQAIRKILATGKEVRILVLTDHPTMSYGPFAIAGLIRGGGAARHLGTAVHELLAQVEWLGEEPHYTGGTAEGAKLAREFLASDRAKILKKPGENFTVWRERAYDAEVDGRSVSGIFGRVHVEFGKDGKSTSARIYDFKTDKGNVDLRERYEDQLDAYIKAAALLLGISPDKIQDEPIRVR